MFKLNIEVSVSILFGLEVLAFDVINFTKEVFMNNSFVNSCVWCGMAFLRGHGGAFQSKREIKYLFSYSVAKRNVEEFESPPSHLITRYFQVRKCLTKNLSRPRAGWDIKSYAFSAP